MASNLVHVVNFYDSGNARANYQLIPRSIPNGGFRHLRCHTEYLSVVTQRGWSLQRELRRPKQWRDSLRSPRYAFLLLSNCRSLSFLLLFFTHGETFPTVICEETHLTSHFEKSTGSGEKTRYEEKQN